jgi:flagellar motor switch protein FliN/FliY
VSNEPARNLERLMNVTVRVSAELGRCSLRVRDVLNLGTGSIVELDRAADGPIDVLVNDEPIARGEVIAVGERFGVRITEVVAHSAPAGAER